MDQAEKLRIVAEALGYDALQFMGFDPIKTPAQVIECMDWLIKQGHTLFMQNKNYCWRSPSGFILCSASLAHSAIDAIVQTKTGGW